MTCTHVEEHLPLYRVLMNHCSVENWMAQPALPLESRKGTVLLEMGRGVLSDEWFKKTQKTRRSKSHSLHQPFPQVVLLLGALLPSVKVNTWSCHSSATTPHGAQLSCCTMPESLLKMLWVETGVLFTTGRLLFIGLGLRKENVFDFRSTLQFCSAFLVFRAPANYRNYILFGTELIGRCELKAHGNVSRNLFLHRIKWWWLRKKILGQGRKKWNSSFCSKKLVSFSVGNFTVRGKCGNPPKSSCSLFG